MQGRNLTDHAAKIVTSWLSHIQLQRKQSAPPGCCSDTVLPTSTCFLASIRCCWLTGRHSSSLLLAFHVVDSATCLNVRSDGLAGHDFAEVYKSRRLTVVLSVSIKNGHVFWRCRKMVIPSVCLASQREQIATFVGVCVDISFTHRLLRHSFAASC